MIAHTLAAGSTTDEIVVVDRGSGDRTLAILRESPARVYACDPSDAPSSCWNAAFLKATRDWILALDATEFLPIQSLQRLKSQLSRSNPPDGYRLPIGDGRTGCFLGWETRLVRNATSIRRAYLAGADLEAAIRQAGGRIEELDLPILASDGGRWLNHLSPRWLQEDLMQYRGGEHAFQLGKHHFLRGNYFHAECYLSQSLEQSAERKQEITGMLALCFERMGEPHRLPELHPFDPPSHHIDAAGIAQELRERRLYLGAGRKSLAGYTTVDVIQGETVDMAWDLAQRPWPWDNDSVAAIVAEDVVEHLGINPIEFCDEAWRVMRAGGELFIRTPHHEGVSSWIDPTHRWHLHEQSFDYLEPERHWGKVHPHYTERKWRDPA